MQIFTCSQRMLPQSGGIITGTRVLLNGGEKKKHNSFAVICFIKCLSKRETVLLLLANKWERLRRDSLYGFGL